ncbi:MAG: MFS transporter, partial [Flavobacteriaceae bacterium]|nr:MFS transporter [Flavobacteriaceae bacterium]
YGYEANKELAQSEHVIQGVKLLVSLYPAIPFLIGIVLLFFYEIDKKMETQIEIDLRDRRINK